MILLQQKSAFQKDDIHLKIYAMKQQEIEMSNELSLFPFKKDPTGKNN